MSKLPFLTEEEQKVLVRDIADENAPGWDLVTVLVQRKGCDPIPVLQVRAEDGAEELVVD